MKKGLTFFMKQQKEQREKVYSAIVYSFLLEDLKNAIHSDLETQLNYQLNEQVRFARKQAA